MATVVARLEAILSARTHDFDRAIDRSESKIHNTGKVAGRAGLAIAGGLAFGLERSVKAALDAQASQARLAQAFSNAHLNALKYEPQVLKLEASSRKLGFTEEDVHKSLASLITSTGSYTAAARQMAIAQDLARFKGVGLEQATKALTMAHAGSLRPLKQLGLDITKVTDAQDKLKASVKDHTTAAYAAALATAKLQDKSATFAKVLEVTTGAVHGQADAYSKTAAGSMEAFKAQLNFLEISMGQGLLPILAKVSTAVANASAYFAKHHQQAKLLTIALGVLAGALIAARTAQLLMNLAVLANPYVAAIAAVVAAGIAIYVFRDKLMNVFNWIKAHYPLLTAIIAGPIGLAVAEIIKHRDAIANAFTSLPGMVGDAIGGAMHFLRKKLEDIFDWHRIVGWIKDALGFHSPSPYFMAIGTDMVHSMAHGVGAAAGVLKDAVVRLAEGIPGKIGAAIFPSGNIRVGSHQGNVALGRQMAAQRGWSGPEWTALYDLWSQESGWNQFARNASSGAYGIPQALPPTKMPRAAQASGGSHPAAQIGWGLNYIAGRYGDPLRAWAHEQQYNWYDRGGWLPQGLSLALNTTGAPERVGGPQQVIAPISIGGQHIATVIFDLLRGKAKVYENRNNRPAFGGG